MLKIQNQFLLVWLDLYLQRKNAHAFEIPFFAHAKFYFVSRIVYLYLQFCWSKNYEIYAAAYTWHV